MGLDEIQDSIESVAGHGASTIDFEQFCSVLRGGDETQGTQAVSPVDIQEGLSAGDSSVPEKRATSTQAVDAFDAMDVNGDGVIDREEWEACNDRHSQANPNFDLYCNCEHGLLHTPK